jgi:hypothetical protein
MEFNSQICTTQIQSERLLALGLKKETADMCINLSHEPELVYSFSYGEALSLYHNYGLDRITNTDSLLPAWSLHRLIELLGLSKICLNIDLYDSPYEEIIRRIDVFIHTGVFNKEYLE